MNENGTVQQLSKALNQLLDAYEILQKETKNLKEDNTLLSDEVEDLELKNMGLESKLAALADTTKHTSTEMDTMLGRIETILGSSVASIQSEDEEELYEIEEEDETVITELKLEEKKDQSLANDHDFHQKQEENREIDLGRMQTLLNGFNNN